LLLVSSAAAVTPLNSSQGAAQAGAPATSATNPSKQNDVEEFVAPDSPRSSIEAFLRLCRTGQYALAARYLNVPPTKATRAADLARRLQAVIDRRLEIDLDALSPLSEGSGGTRIPRYEEMGRMRSADGKLEPLKLVQKDYPGPDARWVFSQSVVARVDDWYAELEGRWFLEHLPPYLQRRGPYNLTHWQWLALPALLIATWFVGYLLSRISRAVLAFFAARTRPTWDDEIVTNINGPLVLIWALVLGSAALPWLALPVVAERFGQSLVKGGFLFSFFWVLSRLVDAWGKRLIVSQWARGRAVSNSLITLGVRVGKIAVLIVAVVALVSAMGYPAASLLAGLGVGGLAVALAAQKTLEHLFGAFAIGADRPFNEGDFIKVEDVAGTVELIGLRSTRIRTLDRTVITIPNGKLSEMRVESFAERDKLLLSCKFGLVYETSADQMHQVLDGFEQILNSHPKVEPGATVRFTGFGTSGLTVEVMAWFLTTDWAEFQIIRQETYLKFMQCVGDAGTAIALPAQRIQLHAQSPN
jgi:MscS family membrane protein